MKEKFTTSIIVKETRVTSTGATRSGGTYTLYQVIATKPGGEPISLNLRAFEDLPKNEVIEVDAELYRSPQYGDSYTISRKGSRKGRTKVDELEERVERIERFLQGRGEFAGSAAPQPTAQPAAQPPPPPPPAPEPEPAPPAPPPEQQVQPDPPATDEIPF